MIMARGSGANSSDQAILIWGGLWGRNCRYWRPSDGNFALSSSLSVVRASRLPLNFMSLKHHSTKALGICGLHLLKTHLHAIRIPSAHKKRRQSILER